MLLLYATLCFAATVVKKRIAVYYYLHLMKRVTGRIQKKFEKRGAEDKLLAPSSFIGNTRNDLLAFYTEKGGFLEREKLNQ